MRLDTKVRILGEVETAPLKKAVAAIPDEAWFEDQTRQNLNGNHHKDTQSIVMLFCKGWPHVEISRRSGWPYIADAALPLMEHIQRTYYEEGGIVFRAMVAKLLPGGHIPAHQDINPSFAVAHRIHVPLATNPDVDFTIGGEVFHFEEDVAFEINNLAVHSVHNRSDKDRLHFIFDYAPKQ